MLPGSTFTRFSCVTDCTNLQGGRGVSVEEEPYVSLYTGDKNQVTPLLPSILIIIEHVNSIKSAILRR